MRQSHTAGVPHSRSEWATEIAKFIGSTALIIFLIWRIPNPAFLSFPVFLLLALLYHACSLLAEFCTVPPLAEFADGLGALVFLGWLGFFLIQLVVIYWTESPAQNLLFTPFTVLGWLGVTYLALCDYLLLIGLVIALGRSLLARLRASA